MAKDNPARIESGQRPLWFNILLLLDTFALGGLVVWRVVLVLLADKMVDPLRPGALDMLVGIDHTLLPYWFGHTVIAVLLVWITAGVYAWLRTRARIVPALTLVIPTVLVVWLMASRW